MKHIHKITNYCYYGLLFFLPISTFLDNVALLSLTFLTLFFKKRKHTLKQLLFSSLWLLFAYIILLNILDSNLETKVYIKLLPLLIIPFIFSYIKKETLEKGLLFLFIAIIIKQFVAIAGILEYYFFTEGKTVALRSYAGINEILHFERPYLGFFSALNIIVSYYLFKNRKIWIFLITSVFSFSIIMLISARLGLIVAILSLLLIVISRIKINFKYLMLVIGTLTTLGIIFLMSNNPLKNRFQQIKYDTRLVVWNGAYNIFTETSQPFFGLKSQSKVSEKLIDYYKNDAYFEYQPDKTRFVNKVYNTHNQYLNEILRGGIFGLLLFMMPLCYLIFQNIKMKKLEFTLLLISVSLFFMVENLLARQIGVYTTAIILSLTQKTLNEKS